MKKHRASVFLFSCLTLVGCQSYTAQNKQMRKLLYAGDYLQAQEKLEKSPLAKEKQSTALYQMESGMLFYLQQDYPPAIQNWLNADKKLDDLYTTSVSRTATSLVVNDGMSDYSGESYERILLPLFTSLAFFAEDNISNALVMVRRTHDLEKAFIQQGGQSADFLRYDLFSRYFSGMMYEAMQQWDNAIVEYQLTAQMLQTQPQTQANFTQATQLVVSALGRLAAYRGRLDILQWIQKNWPAVRWENQQTLMQQGEVYIVYESGNVPIKVEKDTFIPTDKTIVRISFPEYENVPYRVRTVTVKRDGVTMGTTAVMAEIGAMAKQALSDRRATDGVKMAARLAAKELAARELYKKNPLAGLAANALGIITEVADTRSWTTLPDTLQVFRLPVQAGKPASITVTPEGEEPIQLNVLLLPGEKKLFRLRTTR